jgi:hypothetical protein
MSGIRLRTNWDVFNVAKNATFFVSFVLLASDTFSAILAAGSYELSSWLKH